jgi:hypothetical protein
MSASTLSRSCSREAQTTVYRGRDAVGAIWPRGRQWLARDDRGRRIGAFPTRMAAFSAVLRREADRDARFFEGRSGSSRP